MQAWYVNRRTSELGRHDPASYDAGNRLSSLTNGLGSTWAITTDGRGNITANALKAQAYQFDLAHRMNAVTGKESYLYDGHGRRARSLNLQTGTIEYYGYGKDGRLLQDCSSQADREWPGTAVLEPCRLRVYTVHTEECQP